MSIPLAAFLALGVLFVCAVAAIMCLWTIWNTVAEQHSNRAVLTLLCIGILAVCAVSVWTVNTAWNNRMEQEEHQE